MDSAYEESDNHSVKANTSHHVPSSLYDSLSHQQLATLTSNPISLADKENNPAVLALAQQIDSSLIDDEVLQVAKPSIGLNFSGAAGFSVYCDDESVKKKNPDADTTNIQDVSMECSLPATDSIFSSTDSVIIDGTRKRREFSNSPMELTGIMPNSRVYHSNRVSVVGKLTNFGNLSMEMTEVMSSSRFVVEKSHFFDDMEIIEAVTSRFAPSVHDEDEKTEFCNKSMEMTEFTCTTII